MNFRCTIRSRVVNFPSKHPIDRVLREIDQSLIGIDHSLRETGHFYVKLFNITQNQLISPSVWTIQEYYTSPRGWVIIKYSPLWG